MNTSPHRRLPFLLALIVAVAAMPTNIVQINAWNHGTEETEPWRSQLSSTPIVRHVVAFRDCVREWCAGLQAHPLLADERGEASVDLLTGGMAGMLNASRLKTLRQQKEDLTAAYNAVNLEISAIGAAIGDKPMTDTQRENFNALKSKKADIKGRLETNAEMLTVAEELNAAAKSAETKPTQTGDDVTSQRAGLQVGKDRSEDDPKYGFKSAREFFHAVMDAGMGRRVDKRLNRLRSSGPNAAQQSDEQGEYDNRYGGYFVPHAIAPGVLSIAPESDPISALCTQVQMEAPTVSFNARTDKNHATSVSGGFRVYRRAEAVDGTPSRATFEQVTLTANEEMGIVFATERLITDSPISIVSIIQAGMASEYVANGMNERINGTGNGERQGVLQTPCLISVSKETGQAAATIVKENIDKMEARCWKYGEAVWLANHNTRPQLKSLVQVVGVGGVAVPYFSFAGGQETLSGRPIYFTEFAATLGTVGDLMLIVPSQYLEGTYQTEQFAESMHVRFVGAERAFRFYRRNDGQWWWRSALTPKNGSTLSPCVALATRS